MYNIYMYNEWFGDCFRLNDGEKNLFIDFGIHENCLKSNISICGSKYASGKFVARDDVHKTIADEIRTYQNPDLLITHYHLDHISGLLYMKNNGYRSPIFNKVYLPDIWSFPDSKNIVALLILEDLMNNCKINKRACTLIDLVEFLCKDVGHVELLHRGKSFDDDNFIALWPDSGEIGVLGEQIYTIEQQKWMSEIIHIADELVNIVKLIASTERNDNMDSQLTSFEMLSERIVKIVDNHNFSEFVNENEVMLNSLGNNISIVFQNKEDCDNNMLFTGDLGSHYLKKISANKDNKVRMHKKYKYIKIPHHGTKGEKDSHYYDFSSYEPEILMFPNGKCMMKSYKISDKYKNDIISVKSKGTIKVYCSNSNYCEMNSTGKVCDCKCEANSINIIFPYVSRLVL